MTRKKKELHGGERKKKGEVWEDHRTSVKGTIPIVAEISSKKSVNLKAGGGGNQREDPQF